MIHNNTPYILIATDLLKLIYFEHWLEIVKLLLDYSVQSSDGM